MGLFKFFKKMFKQKSLAMPKLKETDFIQPLSRGYDVVVLNQELVVQPNWIAVIVAKGLTLDVFGEGTHKMGLAYLPKTTKALSLDKGKVVKHGVTAEVVLPEKFKCDIYFVFMGENNARCWKSDEIRVKSKTSKHLHYYLEGTYDFQIQDPEKAIKLFLIDWGKIKTGKAGPKLDFLIGDMCSDVLWAKKFNSKKQLAEFDFANTVFKPAVNKTLKTYGIVVTNMQIKNIVFPESFTTTRYEEVFPDDSQQDEILNAVPEIAKVKKLPLKTETVKDKEQNVETEEKPQKKPRFFTNEVKTKQIESNSNKFEISSMVKDSLSEIENEGKRKKKKIPVYTFGGDKKNKAYKTADKLGHVCPRCGFVNSEDIVVCQSCGHTLKGD